MRFRLVALALIVGVAIGSGLVGARSNRQTPGPPDHIAWVTDVLKRMQTIKVGMTRTELLSVFTTEGGIYGPLQRTFVSRDCPYFKVDVEFEAVGRPATDVDGRGAMVEGNQDRIVKISRPYLQFSHMD